MTRYLDGTISESQRKVTKSNNSDTDVAGATGVFLALALVGATGDKRLLGEFTRLQSTST